MLAVSQFKGQQSKSTLTKILSSAKVTQAYTQVVAGINKTYVLKTSRGYECFKIYIDLEDKKELINYSRGQNESEVYSRCRSFRDVPPSQVLVSSALDL